MSGIKPNVCGSWFSPMSGTAARRDIAIRIRIEVGVFRRCGFRVALAKKALFCYWLSNELKPGQYNKLRLYVERETTKKPVGLPGLRVFELKA